MYDSPKLIGLRNELIKNLLKKGIKNKDILRAFFKVPRHLFIHKNFESYAYTDVAFPIDDNQTISQPFTVAFQTQLLDIRKGYKVLEIGTGSGFQTAVLVFLGAEVYTIERIHNLYKKSKKILDQINLMPKKNIWDDGHNGFESFSPFDRIIITAACETPPNNLLKQLKINGKMVVPIGKNVQKMTLFIRVSENKFEKRTFGDYRFVPMLRNKN
jgi:protein-L-isoaspartate(D-aspartate) O-methyltransferase